MLMGVGDGKAAFADEFCIFIEYTLKLIRRFCLKLKSVFALVCKYPSGIVG